MSVSELFLQGKYSTDKYNLGYLEGFYDKEFPKLQKSCKNLLEIGCLKGESIKLWKDYFTCDNVYGIDIQDYPQVPGTHKIIGNAYSDKIVNLFQDDFFDIIIDDGPHTYQSFLDVIKKYQPKLKDKGLLVIEDIIRPWQGRGVTPDQQKYLKQYSKQLGYKLYKEYNFTNQQKTSDLRHKWSNGIYIITMTR